MINAMHILATPAFRGRELNPYNWLLYTYIKNLGIQVDELSHLKLLTNRYTIWHIHWPELPLNEKSIIKAFIKIKVLLIQIDWARRRGTKIVWTIHNLSAHEGLHSKLSAWFWKAFTQRLDGCISLSETGMTVAQHRFPELKSIPGFVVSHGHYREEYPNQMNTHEARTSLELPYSAKVLLFFGRIRFYKNVPQLIKAFRQLPDSEAILCIVGCPDFPELAEEIKQEASLDSRIRLYLNFVPQDKAQLYFQAADLVVLPYREILNSGSAILALSFDRPILVPLYGALGELQDHVGKEWVRTYTGDINTFQIEAALKWIRNTSRSQHAPLEAFAWNELAQQTITAYKAIADIK